MLYNGLLKVPEVIISSSGKLKTIMISRTWIKNNGKTQGNVVVLNSVFIDAFLHEPYVYEVVTR